MYVDTQQTILSSTRKSYLIIARNYNSINVIAKIKENSGRTMWAKAITMNYQMINFGIVDTELFDDWIWVRLYSFNFCRFQFYELQEVCFTEDSCVMIQMEN